MAFGNQLLVSSAADICLDPFGDGSQLAFYKFNNTINSETGSYNFNNNTTSYTTGKYNQGIQLTTTTYIRGTGLTTNLPLTISLWYNPTTSNVPVGQLINRRLSATNGFSIISYYNSTTSLNVIEFLNNGGPGPTGPIKSVTPNVWYHILVSIDSSGWQSYVNGVAEGSVLGTVTAPAGAEINVGYLAQANWVGADGKVDQLRIFNKALNATEALYIYNNDSSCG